MHSNLWKGGSSVDRSRRSIILKKRLMKAGGGLFRTIFLLGVGYVTLYPLLFMISTSFMSVSDTLDATVVWLPSGLNWFNFPIIAQKIVIK